jgi:hypothetical protein
MFYVGLDVHTKFIAFCVLSDKGQLVQRGQVRGLEEVLRILHGLPDRFEVCYQASCGYGHFHDLLRPLAARVVVAHPGARLADPFDQRGPTPRLRVQCWKDLRQPAGGHPADEAADKEALQHVEDGHKVRLHEASCGYGQLLL